MYYYLTAHNVHVRVSKVNDVNTQMYYGDFVRRLKIDLNYMGMKTFLNK